VARKAEDGVFGAKGGGVLILGGKASRKNVIKRPAETMRYLTVKEIDVFLEQDKKGYALRAEFVKDAVRRLLDCYSDEGA
jgi:hypothetical protein